jgi:hypothetical protein
MQELTNDELIAHRDKLLHWRIDRNELVENRGKLINFQREKWNKNTEGIRLHLGCGHIRIPNYINVDLYSDDSDLKEDIRHLSFKSNSVTEIVCQHALEHLPIRDIFPTLQHWYDILAEGGTIEVGMPDLELCLLDFLNAPEEKRWNEKIWYLLGCQTDSKEYTLEHNSSLRDYFPFSKGQVHMGGLALGYFVRMVEDAGFRILDAYDYDAYGAPSQLVYAIKETKPIGNELEQNCVAGVYTHRTIYLPKLWESAHKYIPEIQFITHINHNTINYNMSLLLDDFRKSGKRYWLILDDDVVILNSDIVRNALQTLVDGDYGAVSIYSVMDDEFLSLPYSPENLGLEKRQLNWMAGYFMLVDSSKVGDIQPDMALPFPWFTVDISYSLSIRSKGFDIGVSPDYIFHAKKYNPLDREAERITSEYLMKKWGDLLLKWGNNPMLVKNLNDYKSK